MTTAVATPEPAPAPPAPNLAESVLGEFNLNGPPPIQVPAPPVDVPAPNGAPAPEAAKPDVPAPEKPGTDVEPDPYASLTEAPVAPTTWEQPVLDALKARGIENPDAFIANARTAEEQIATMRQQMAQYEELVGAEQKLDPLAKEMLTRIREGKDVLKWAREQAPVDLLKPAAKYDKMDLVTGYFPKAFTPEQVEAYRNNDDPALVKEINERLEQWLPLAQEKHEAARQAPLQQREQEKAQAKADREALERSVAASLTYLKSTAPSMAIKADAKTIEAFTTGRLFMDTFCESDGKTYKPTAFLGLLFAQDPLGIVERVKAAGHKAGVEEERLRQAGRLPANSAQGNAARLTPDQLTEHQKAQLGLLSEFRQS